MSCSIDQICSSPACRLISELLCCHCHQQYCYLCFMSHRKSLLNDMKSISEQMSYNRQQSVNEVVEFINKQACDAHEQTTKLINDAIQRIKQRSQAIFKYIEYRRQLKTKRLKACLERFDHDAHILHSNLSQQNFLSAKAIVDYRQRYAYNMFESSRTLIIKNDSFFSNYRYFNELLHLRQKWTFLQDALTTVYYPKKQVHIPLDQILTFLEYRHDRVMENYRIYLSKNEQSKDLSLKSCDELLADLSFLVKKQILIDNKNFLPISDY